MRRHARGGSRGCARAASAAAARCARRRSVTPSRSSIAATAASWRRQASAQMIAKPAAIAGHLRERRSRATAGGHASHSSSGHRRLKSDARPAVLGHHRRGARVGQQPARSAAWPASRRPSARADQRRHDPPAGGDEHERVVAVARRAPSDGDDREHRRRAGAEHDRRPEEVDEAHRVGYAASSASSRSRTPRRPVDDHVGLRARARAGVSSERTPTHTAGSSRPRRPARAAPRKASTSVAVVARVERRRRCSASSQQLRDARGPCRSRPAGAPRAPCGPSASTKPASSARAAISRTAASAARPRRARRASGRRRSTSLSSAAHAQALQLVARERPRRTRCTRADPRRPARRRSRARSRRRAASRRRGCRRR